MRILIASVDAFPAMGGISVMTHHLADTFAALGHHVVFLGPRGTYVPAPFTREYHLIEDLESEVSARGGTTAALEDRRLATLLGSILDEHAIDRALLLHPFYYAVPLIHECRKRRIGVSCYFHGYEIQSQLRDGYPRNHRRLVQGDGKGTLRERVFYTVGAVDEVLVNSRYTQAIFDNFDAAAPVRVTGCGVPELLAETEAALSPRWSRVERSQRREHLGLDSRATVAFVGRLVPTKRADRLIELCAEQDSLAALIVGDGPDQDRLHTLARSYGVESRVRFTGAVTESEKWDLLRAVDFLALLSEPDPARGQVEGFGISLLEGAAAGAVPVSAGTGGMLDVVEDDATGLILPPGMSNAGARLVECAADEARMDRILSAARQQLRSKYTWRRIAEVLLARW